MKIIIEYDSSWRNSFLDGSNNAPLPSKGREFLGSMTNLKKEGHFKTCESTIDTVMGLLNRLIGDQRKLYQARSKKFEGQYFFEELEGKVSFVDKPVLTNEMTYIRNMKGSTDQNSFTGMIKVSDPILNSDYSQEFWGVLDFSFEKLCSFIVHGCSVESHLELNPLAIIDRLELLFKEKAVACEGDVNKALDVLADSFPGIEYLNNKGLVTPVSFYCSALYLQLERLSEKYDMSSARTKAGGISGISKKGFTKKDFMDRYTTGAKKRIWGNPYIKKEKIKGQGEVTSMMTKASGQLEILIDVDRDKGQEIKTLIENAGVSSFYLGKKGIGLCIEYQVVGGVMHSYIDIEVKPDSEMRENVLMNKVYTKLHKSLFEMQAVDIGVSFPLYNVKLGRVLRIHSSEERLCQLRDRNWLGGLAGYCAVANIQSIPGTVKHRTVSRIQSNMTQSKLKRLLKRGSITDAEVKAYKAKMFSIGLDNPYFELESGSNGHKHRRYVCFGELLDHPVDGEFDSFGFGKGATVPWF